MNFSKQANKRIRTGDTVIAIAGNEKGKVGKVLRRLGDKIVVQGLNVRKKHVKASQGNPKGGVLEFEKPIHASNLKVCVEEDKPVKLRVREGDEGSRELYYLDESQEVLYRPVREQQSK